MNETLHELGKTFPGETLPQLLRSDSHTTQSLEADIRYVKHILLVMNSILQSGSVSKRYGGAAPGTMTATGSLREMTETLSEATQFYATLNAATLIPDANAVTHQVIDKIRHATRLHIRYFKAALWCTKVSEAFVRIAGGMRSSAAKPSVPYITANDYESRITADFIISTAGPDLLAGLLVRKTLIPVLPHLTDEELDLVAGLIEFTSKGREWVGPLLSVMKKLKEMSPYIRIFRECFREDEFKYWSRTMTGIIGKIPSDLSSSHYLRNMSRLATRAVFVECALAQQPDGAPVVEVAEVEQPQESKLILHSVNTFDNLNRTETVTAAITTVGAFIGTRLNTTIAEDYSLSEAFLQQTNDAIAASKPMGVAPDFVLTILNGAAKIPHHVIQAVHGVMMGESESLGVITAAGVRKYPSLAFIVDGALRLRYAKHVLTTRTIFNRDGVVVAGTVSDELIERLWSAKLVIVGHGGLTYSELLDMAQMYANDGCSSYIQLTAARKLDLARTLKDGAHRIGIGSMITASMTRSKINTALIKSIDTAIAEHKGETAAKAAQRAAELARSSQDEYRVAVAALADGRFYPSDGYQKGDRIITSFNPLAQHLVVKKNTLRAADGTLVYAVKVHDSDTLRLLIIGKLFSAKISIRRLTSGISEDVLTKICEAHIDHMQSYETIDTLAGAIVRLIKENVTE